MGASDFATVVQGGGCKCGLCELFEVELYSQTSILLALLRSYTCIGTEPCGTLRTPFLILFLNSYRLYVLQPRRPPRRYSCRNVASNYM